ncbi:MAG: carboxypeptidase regulatory-like domain-containing protein, partial [Candidatus Sulfotelmatobacter sp.]
QNDEEKNSMKVGRKVVALTSALLIFAFGLLYSGRTVSAASTGQVTGTVKLDGTAPHQKPIDMGKEPICAAVHKDKPVTTENVVVGANGGLANVVVYISQGLTGNEAAAPSQPVQLEQKGCQYLPHVVVVDAGQHLKIVNADQTSHNIYAQATKNPPWNKSQPPGAQPLDASWTNEEIAIPVKCNVHPWMHAYVAVVKGPYGVSDDSGSFKLDVPPGTYTLTAWHETYGTQTQNVTVAAGKPAAVNFTFKAK